MLIRKILPALIVVATGSMASSFASAATTGLITFTGALTADTCLFTNSGGNNFSFTLPSEAAATVTGAGVTGATTAFNISMTGCAASVPIRAQFSAGTQGIVNDRLTRNGVASNVQMQLINAAAGNAPILLSQATGILQNSPMVMSDATGAVVLPFGVRYYATGVTTAGSVTSTVNYQITYN